MGENAVRDRQQMSVGCVRAIYKAWHKLSPKYRPDQPKKLMQILGDYHQYPIPDYLFNVDANELTKSVDGTFDIFMKAASDLAAALPASDGWHVLYGILEDRLPPGNDDGEMLRLLIETESFLKRFSAFPPLAVRRACTG